ncbi:hypothetical protein H4R18_003483 [Coemansia javaensis]|uniref:Uncharacterized protein n=1 Tax=Coemansia javaensis TaxID=2761396 RepID=A0A9W8LHM1_9FUNG|nr:hypothetical protein H4R18_003483 [Coemansia javaensis]
MKCSDISEKQQTLLFQCYCKTTYNTNFVNIYRGEDRIVCTRGDRNTFDANMTTICDEYQKYDGCPGVHISAASTPAALSVTKVAVVVMLVVALLA